MAKIPFSKLDIKVGAEKVSKTYTNSKGEEINYEIIKYLPYEEKIELVSRIINLSIDENNYYNPMRIKLYLVLEVVYAYTNFSFTTKIKEDVCKLYDMLIQSGIFDEVLSVIGEDEWNSVKINVQDTIENIYKYRNSVLGILDSVATDYSNLQLDAQSIQQQLADPNNMELLKAVLTKLG